PEHHEAGSLEYRFTPKKGIPFPAFTEASGDFPELRVEAEWHHDGVAGRAIIENGRLVDQQDAQSREAGVAVTLGENGRLEVALICERTGDGWDGYAASSDGHTYV